MTSRSECIRTGAEVYFESYDMLLRCDVHALRDAFGAVHTLILNEGVSKLRSAVRASTLADFHVLDAGSNQPIYYHDKKCIVVLASMVRKTARQLHYEEYGPTGNLF